MWMLSPVGWLPDGTPIWPVAGGDGEGSTGESGSGTESGGTGDGDNNTNGTEDGDEQIGDDPAKLRDALAKARQRVQELSNENADRRVKGKTTQQQLEEAQAELRKLADKDKSELEIAKRTAQEEKDRADGLAEQVKTLRIQNAFFTNNKYEWVNPEHAMRLADMSEVTIDDEGKVTGLDKALQNLAKTHAYLLKQKQNGTGGGATQPSGPANAGRATPPAGAGSRQDKENRFPALRSRPPTS